MKRVLITLAIAAAASLGLTAGARARSATLVFDAVYRHAAVLDTAPAGDSVGDRQVVSGILRDAHGRRVGKFQFTCGYVRMVAGDAHEHCTGTGGSGDGALRFSGPAVKSDHDHTWTFTGTSGALKGAHGRGFVHDATNGDSVVVLELRNSRIAHLCPTAAFRAAVSTRASSPAPPACVTEPERRCAAGPPSR